MSSSVQSFLSGLEGSGLLSPEDLARIRAEARRHSDTRQLAKALVRAGKLTRFQAAVLYRGGDRPLALGNYVLLDELGRGGMGVVYKAVHRRMERFVALKVLPERATASEESLQRFHREIKAVARLSHPNIVTAYDADEARGVHFLVMEYVNGTDLRSLVSKHGPLEAKAAADCILQAARGLQCAHERGVIHRDVKPANLLRRDDGTVMVLDLGLARLDDAAAAGSGEGAEASDLTQAGSIMGTLDYMAPEQFSNAAGADERSDIYSLGCTLYFLVTGNPPYGEDSHPQFKRLAHMTQPPPPWPQAAEYEPLERIYQKMMAKEPAERHQSMKELVFELENIPSEEAASLEWLEDRSIPSATVAARSDKETRVGGKPSALVKDAKPRRPRWNVVAGVCAVMAITIGALWLSRNSSQPEADGHRDVAAIGEIVKPSKANASAASIDDSDDDDSRPSAIESAAPRLIYLDDLNAVGNARFPWLSEDGSTIYFESGDPNESPGSWIWMSARPDAASPFEPPVELFPGRHPTLSSSQLIMLLLTQGGSGRPSAIAAAFRDSASSPFGPPTIISSLRKYENPKSPCLSQNGLKLYFQGGTDKRVRFLQRDPAGSEWSETELFSIATSHSLDVDSLTWLYTFPNWKWLFCSYENFGNMPDFCRLVVWKKSRDDGPFDQYAFLDVPGIGAIYGRSPRYVPATKELFFTAPRDPDARRTVPVRPTDLFKSGHALAKIENFDPEALDLTFVGAEASQP